MALTGCHRACPRAATAAAAPAAAISSIAAQGSTRASATATARAYGGRQRAGGYACSRRSFRGISGIVPLRGYMFDREKKQVDVAMGMRAATAAGCAFWPGEQGATVCPQAMRCAAPGAARGAASPCGPGAPEKPRGAPAAERAFSVPVTRHVEIEEQINGWSAEDIQVVPTALPAAWT
ncbi:unnamed protein product [Prorocentrum cordatum]|uniref:Uncharacterized protein n=1 Tax=Prorocentrum cordatum TaxID=2364126 RepID=A0ABN9WL08_9DINO|nr:unnamed protein product [Polarella glacialis]